jgi:FAD/FMN-containing dehydrogenase|tara:strand:+ start:167 stop:1462 length:1296 start_codon:yes stop_codon:yes gene_type:complete
MNKLSSWGNTSKSTHEIHNLFDKESSKKLIARNMNGIVYGMGRSYGDVCLNPGGIAWKNSSLDKLLSLDEKLGILECESGVTLKFLQEFLIPKGWMLPVSPGTQYVSVGGAVANDIHGKNHHQSGSFGTHVLEITLLRSSGESIICSQNTNKDWFEATIGGIGLTGIIYSCKIQLRKIHGPWLETESIPFHNLEGFFELSDSSETNWEYTAAWIDCMSKGDTRGIFERGRHISISKEFKKKVIKFPFTPPFSLVNKLSLRLFNPLYFFYKKTFSGKKRIQHYTKFLHPLDNILHWNKMYGPRGFYQFQCVIPLDNRKEIITKILRLISESQSGSFLAVLKTFSNFEPEGLLSFAEPGVTLALDFPNQGKKTKKLFHDLEAIVKSSKGKIYLAKDLLMTRETFESSYPGLNTFKKFRDINLSSQMSKRLMGF